MSLRDFRTTVLNQPKESANDVFGFDRQDQEDEYVLFRAPRGARLFWRCRPRQEPCRDEAACVDVHWHDANQIGKHSGRSDVRAVVLAAKSRATSRRSSMMRPSTLSSVSSFTCGRSVCLPEVHQKTRRRQRDDTWQFWDHAMNVEGWA